MKKLNWLLPVLRVLRTIGPLALGLVALVLVIAWVSGFFLEKIPAGAAETQVRKLAPGTPTDTVHEVTKTYYEEAVGTLRAASRTEISSRVLAPIEKIHVRAGQAVRSVAIRTRPILLTAGTTLLGNWVITLDPIFSGLAWAIIFGIVASTLFTLVVVPVVYWLLYRQSGGHVASDSPTPQ